MKIVKSIFLTLLFINSLYCNVTKNITIDRTLQLTNNNLNSLDLSITDLNLLFGLSGLITSMYFLLRIKKI